MPFNKEQQKAYYEANKAVIKQKRRYRYLKSKGQVEQINNVLPIEGEQIVLPSSVLPKKEVEQKLVKVEQSEKGEQKNNVLPNFVKPCPNCPKLEKELDNLPEKIKSWGKIYIAELDKEYQERIKELEAEIIKLKTDLAKQYEKFFTENEQQKSTHKQKLPRNKWL